ncbi:MAG TPA: S9 family peptidase [Gemmatimonadales bacterium]|jgi:dipeptidyl aminopeptidase/acylaminoacyl peptidase
MSYLDALPPLIPREELFGNPVKTDPQLSPDGRKMAFIAPEDGKLNVWVTDLERDETKTATHDRDRGVRVYFWAHDGRHLVYLQDVGGDENWRMHAVDLETDEIRDLTPFSGVQVQLVARDKRYPHELLIGMNKDDERLHDVYRIDLRTGDLTMVAKNPGDVVGWVADAQFVVRAALAARDNGGMALRVRADGDSEWESRIEWDAEDGLSSGPIGFTLAGDALHLVDSQGANAARLVRLDLATDERTVLAEDAQYDVSGALVHPDTRALQAVSFTRAREEWVVLDRTIANDLERIRALNPGDFAINSRTHDDNVWVISFTEDNRPVSYYRYDRPRGSGELLFYNRPLLAKRTLAHVQPISLKSRDGLTLHGYLTRPPGVAEPIPMVLDVHGGPWHRDVWGYDPEAQWLANRGYACLQINFRGSTGYGKAFLNAGNREWGGKMHDDLVDAVRWAIERGVADPNRVAVYGGSYGGYAALVGAAFTPGLFRCAVDIVGPSNLITFIETVPPYWSSYLEMLYHRVGHPITDREFLESRSPLSRAEEIRIPLLIAQGANDPRVKQSESEQIVAALRDKGIDHQYLLFPDEGHGFAKPENRLKFYQVAEGFLAKHLGGRAEP